MSEFISHYPISSVAPQLAGRFSRCGIRLMSAMNQASLPINRIFAFSIFLVALNLLRTGVATTQSVPRGYTRDNSDWWSYTGRPEADDEAIIQNRELPVSNFQILGLALNDETLDRAVRKM